MTIRDLIVEYLDQDLDAENVDIADRVLRDRRYRSVALPSITDEVRRIRRGRARRVEREMAQEVARRGPREKSSHDLRTKLLEESFALPDGRFVRWGEATLQDHKDRIVWLGGQIDAIQETMDLHEWAIGEIEKNGVTCLDEIEGGGE